MYSRVQINLEMEITSTPEIKKFKNSRDRVVSLDLLEKIPVCVCVGRGRQGHLTIQSHESLLLLSFDTRQSTRVSSSNTS